LVSATNEHETLFVDVDAGHEAAHADSTLSAVFPSDERPVNVDLNVL
jgi:hypothetical protein